MKALEHYVRSRAQCDECHPILHTWAFMSACAAVVGDKVNIPFGDSKINPNMYVLMVGEPASRKSTAIKAAKSLLVQSGYDRIADSSGSMQGWLKAIAKPDWDSAGSVATHVESYIAHDEIINFLGAGNTDFITRLGEMWDKLDGFKHGTAGGTKVSIEELVVNMLGGTTPGQFPIMFPPMIADQGLLSRILLVSAPGKVRHLHRPPPMDSDARDQVVNLFERLSGFHATYDIAEGSEVDNMLRDIYHAYAGHQDRRFATYDGRRYTHLLKIIQLFAAMRESDEISPEDVYCGHTLLVNLESTMGEALGYFGRSFNSAVAAKIIALLRASGIPLAYQQILQTVHTDINKTDELADILHILKQAGKIKQVKEFFVYVRPKSQADVLPYVDMSLLDFITELSHGTKSAAVDTTYTAGVEKLENDSGSFDEHS